MIALMRADDALKALNGGYWSAMSATVALAASGRAEPKKPPLRESLSELLGHESAINTEPISSGPRWALLSGLSRKNPSALKRGQLCRFSEPIHYCLCANLHLLFTIGPSGLDLIMRFTLPSILSLS